MTSDKGNVVIPFVDTHVHFYDMKHPTLYYGDWQPDKDHPNPMLGSQTRKLGQKNYLSSDFIEESAPEGVIKSVHVQAAIGTPDAIDETEWLQNAYQTTGMPNAIIGFVDLKKSSAEVEINRHLEYPNFRGIRDFSAAQDTDYLINEDFVKGFALQQKYDLVSSVSAQWQNMERLQNLAGTFPDIPIVLDHAGFPDQRTPEYFKSWKAGMQQAAEAENIICKISGLGMGDQSWTVESIKPYVETCIEIFSPSRCIFATNWPIDSLWSGYVDVISAYRKIVAHYTFSEVENMFKNNAENLYSI